MKTVQKNLKLDPSIPEYYKKNYQSEHYGMCTAVGEYAEAHKILIHGQMGVLGHVQRFVACYRATLSRELAGMFTAGELKLMIDCMNGTMLTPSMPDSLTANVQDAIALDKLDEKWGVNKEKIRKKLDSLTIHQISCLEIWANYYWYSNPGRELEDLDEYVNNLSCSPDSYL